VISLVIITCALLIGSFLNVCIVRIPKSESLALPRSHCLNCQNTLAFYDLVPVLSFLFLKGKCRNCGAAISRIYPLVEFIAALGTYLLFLNFSLSPVFFAFTFIFYIMIVVTFIDIKHYIIPDVITLPGILIGSALSFFWSPY